MLKHEKASFKSHFKFLDKEFQIIMKESRTDKLLPLPISPKYEPIVDIPNWLISSEEINRSSPYNFLLLFIKSLNVKLAIKLQENPLYSIKHVTVGSMKCALYPDPDDIDHREVITCDFTGLTVKPRDARIKLFRIGSFRVKKKKLFYFSFSCIFFQV